MIDFFMSRSGVFSIFDRLTLALRSMAPEGVFGTGAKRTQPRLGTNTKNQCVLPLCGEDGIAPRQRPQIPLRVVRVIEHDSRRMDAGRIVISGRMADVCAELDRMVAREAALSI
jgi:hypothetical protein